ncbi:unnamed protein product [Brassicogethes aeneus]|uniref:DUF3752 domain-containing protein n=1 Tax=Brassicogethes aeneus TaxID=1431903 RepID=A0A9P0FJP6_BRAAE|nr:unnamed protein product [Brassicogethes aeneus]
MDSSEKNIVIGPELPPHLINSKSTEKIEQKNEIIGPTLPPHLQKNNSVIGPQLPSHLLEMKDSSSNEEIKTDENKYESKSSYIGPVLPAHLQNPQQKLPIPSNLDINSDEDDEVYGPLPVGNEKLNPAQIALEERAIQIKLDKLTNNKNKQSREEWMLELPEVKAANFGLGPRQFRSKTGPDMSDRSSWTDTPSTKKNKKQKTNMDDLKTSTEEIEINKKDLQQEAISKKHKRNKESLVEIHQKKLKNDKKEQSGSGERRPFNRETDLQVNRFDDAQKKAVLKKAQLLDDRFSTGKSKFL